MVTIKKDGHILRVTVGAYKGLYKAMGYTVDENTTEREMLGGEVEANEAEADLDKPVSEMSFRELQAYADYLGINAEGMSKKELKAEILRQEG